MPRDDRTIEGNVPAVLAATTLPVVLLNTALATLASATLKRSGAQQAAALRDTTGRTYVAINIETKSLQLNALEAVFTVALASQITGIESVVYTGEITAPTQLIREYAPRASIFYLSANGDIVTL